MCEAYRALKFMYHGVISSNLLVKKSYQCSCICLSNSRLAKEIFATYGGPQFQEQGRAEMQRTLDQVLKAVCLH